MGFLPFFSLKRLLVAILLALVVAALLLLLRSWGCYSYSFSSTLFFLVLPAVFSFVITKIRQLVMASSMEDLTSESKLDLNLSPEEEIVKENKPQHEHDELQPDETVPSGECSSMDDGNCSAHDKTLEKLSCSALENSDCSVSEEDLASSEIAGSEYSISDDESLIEIALEDGFQQDLKEGLILPEFLPEFSPEMLFRKHGLMELLSEIYEEDNMIEIDITMGSIKCSRFEIEA